MDGRKLLKFSIDVVPHDLMAKSAGDVVPDIRGKSLSLEFFVRRQLSYEFDSFPLPGTKMDRRRGCRSAGITSPLHVST
ncbi:uncharacterized protein LOC110834522 isoform X2 [Zootermopsis nevadensis]|uniref:uncharacterized protein LOC110834522 isoform X2 n=1 Tax=Zootermopsis nevadensis TaxID=136037 RepID=UPI000B8EC531|nr:uncharacterized protein LOC110834522 isoform X2 [Zootermopsis nevadensis]